MTDELLDRMCLELRPMRRDVVGVRLGAAVMMGGLVALVGVAALLGMRADLMGPVGSGMVWAKLAYGGSLGGLGLWGLERLARPGGGCGRLGWIWAPVVLVGGGALAQLALAAPGGRATLVLGSSAAVCPWLIVAAAMPVLAALVWGVRGLAPTRLRLAGAAAGVAAGGIAVCVYTMHCPESGLPFVAVWYSAGVALSCGVGALAGPVALRW